MPANQKGRARPNAYLATGGASVHGRTIVLSTGRGDTKLTPAEARELAAELVREAESSEMLDTHLSTKQLRAKV